MTCLGYAGSLDTTGKPKLFFLRRRSCQLTLLLFHLYTVMHAQHDLQELRRRAATRSSQPVKIAGASQTHPISTVMHGTLGSLVY